jgi:DNA-binding response OmpR family regulator
MRILIVDDEDETLRAMECFLARANVEIMSINDSAEASRLIATEHFDAMFIDYLMPTPNGLDLMAMARKSSVNQETPIILATGYDDVETRSKGAEAGATHFLAKPFTPDKIRRVLWAALKSRGTSQSPSADMTREFVAY